MLDDCEQESFNKAIGPSTCVGDGDTEFGDFLAEVMATGGVDDWRFNPSSVDLKPTEGLNAVNRGGEFHTFTKVARFGGGCVKELNGTLKPVTECEDPGIIAATGAPPGGSVDVRGLKPGQHKFECLIHPWMRTTVTVRAHH